MGRHVSSGRRRSLRGKIFIALVAIVVLLCVAGVAAYMIWTTTRDHPPARHTRTAAPPATLAMTVTGPRCRVFVGVPGGDILVNRDLSRGESVRFDDERLNVVLSDAGAVRVYVNGRPRPPGEPGHRTAFTAVRR